MKFKRAGIANCGGWATLGIPRVLRDEAKPFAKRYNMNVQQLFSAALMRAMKDPLSIEEMYEYDKEVNILLAKHRNPEEK